MAFATSIGSLSSTYRCGAQAPDGAILLPQQTHDRMVEWYFAIWAFLMPLASLLVLPNVQGTIPAYLLAFASPIFCLNRKYWSTLLVLGGVWILFLLLSQVGLLVSGSRAYFELSLIEPADRTQVFRKTLVTQSLYMSACVLIFMFVKQHFRPYMMKYVFYGAWFLVIYGIIEWTISSLTGVSGDFLSNRTYEREGGESREASWSQYYQLGPLRILRLKSMTEEPSRYATLAVAYLSLALVNRQRWLSMALLGTLMLCTSLTGFLAIGLMFAILIWKSGPETKRTVIAAAGVATLLAASAIYLFPDVFNDLILARLNGEHNSTEERSGKLTDTIPIFMHFPVLNQLFGVGFGTAFLPGSLSMLVNVGIVGFVLASIFVLTPIFRLAKSPRNLDIFTALTVLVAIYTFVSSAIFTPVIWMMFGIGYARLDELKQTKELGNEP